MGISEKAVLMRIFIGESDKLGHLPLHEAIVKRARQEGMAGATVLKGVLGYGASDHIRTSKLLDLSGDMPMVIEMVDEASKVEAFRLVLSQMMDESHKGGLVTLEDIRVIHYKPGNRA